MAVSQRLSIPQSAFRWNIPLIGPKNGVNDTFTTPEKFMQITNVVINVFWDGRKLTLGNDYSVSESGGLGTGYDTIIFLFPKKPTVNNELFADYIAE